jgi:hypothetical protein
MRSLKILMKLFLIRIYANTRAFNLSAVFLIQKTPFFYSVTFVFCVSESDEFGTWHATPLEASQLGAWYEQVAPPFSTASSLATTSATPTTVPDDRTPT